MRSFHSFLTEATDRVQALDTRLRRASGSVDGRRVTVDVPNMGSISASFTRYEILSGIREIPLSEFDPDYHVSFYSQTEEDRVKALAQTIAQNKWIDPLIIVYDTKEYPYVLEGGHRIDALELLHARALPALVVVDLD